MGLTRNPRHSAWVMKVILWGKWNLLVKRTLPNLCVLSHLSPFCVFRLWTQSSSSSKLHTKESCRLPSEQGKYFNTPQILIQHNNLLLMGKTASNFISRTTQLKPHEPLAVSKSFTEKNILECLLTERHTSIVETVKGNGGYCDFAKVMYTVLTARHEG